MGAVLLSLATSGVAADTLRLSPVSRPVIEARLAEYRRPNSERAATLKRMFVESGCGEQLSEQKVKRSIPPNVICVLPGTSDRVIVVGAHFDHVLEGDGVADNWSGASLLPSLYQAMKVEARQHSYIFVGFTAEERGLLGSRFYVRRLTPAQVAATDAMINMDTLGLAPTNVWVSRADKRLTLALGYVAQLIEAPLNGVNFEQIGTTDSESFARSKIPRITIHSLTQENSDARILHTSKDKLSVIHPDEYYETYRLLAVYLVYLDHFFDAPETISATRAP
jgi:peptidase M28-like protein